MERWKGEDSRRWRKAKCGCVSRGVDSTLVVLHSDVQCHASVTVRRGGVQVGFNIQVWVELLRMY